MNICDQIRLTVLEKVVESEHLDEIRLTVLEKVVESEHLDEIRLTVLEKVVEKELGIQLQYPQQELL